jgi:hypothetical protein
LGTYLVRVVKRPPPASRVCSQLIRTWRIKRVLVKFLNIITAIVSNFSSFKRILRQIFVGEDSCNVKKRLTRRFFLVHWNRLSLTLKLLYKCIMVHLRIVFVLLLTSSASLALDFKNEFVCDPLLAHFDPPGAVSIQQTTCGNYSIRYGANETILALQSDYFVSDCEQNTTTVSTHIKTLDNGYTIYFNDPSTSYFSYTIMWTDEDTNCVVDLTTDLSQNASTLSTPFEMVDQNGLTNDPLEVS